MARQYPTLKDMREDGVALAKAPRSIYPAIDHPALGRILKIVMTQTPPQFHDLVLKSFQNLTRYNLTQPSAHSAGAKVRQKEWSEMSGERNASGIWRFVFGLVLGAIGGYLVAIGLQQYPWAGDWVYIAAPVLCAITGAALIYLMPAGGNVGMVRIVVNERRSRARPQVVTAQKEIWVPKTLLAWRSHEWRYHLGEPYMWLMLPVRQRAQTALRNTLDFLLLSNDLYRARNSAVYAHRSWLKQVQDNALTLVDVEAGETDQTRTMDELLPWIAGTSLIIASGVMWMFSSGSV